MRNKRIARLAVTATLITGGLVLAGMSAASTGTTSKVSPIVLYTIADVHGPAVAASDEGATEAARVFGAWTNAHGGINGHPLKVVTCDDQNDPNQTTYCARQAVNDHAVAVVGSFTANQGLITPVLQAANISYFGACCAFTQDDFTSKISFPISSFWVKNVATAVAAGANRTCTKPGALLFNTPFEPFQKSFYTNGLKPFGKTIATEALVPFTATSWDLSSQVAQLKNTNCEMVAIGEAPLYALFSAMKQAGTHQRVFGQAGDMVKTCASSWDVCQNAILVSAYPDFSSPVWNTFKAALKQYHAKKLNYSSDTNGTGTWAAYVAFTNIAKTIKGQVDNNSFLTAASSASHVTTGGLTPTLDFAREWTGSPFPRMFNRGMVFLTIKGHKVVPFLGGFHDMSAAFSGEMPDFKAKG